MLVLYLNILPCHMPAPCQLEWLCIVSQVSDAIHDFPLPVSAPYLLESDGMILEGDVVPNHLQEVVADVIESPAHPQASPPALDEHNRPKISFGRKPEPQRACGIILNESKGHVG